MFQLANVLVAVDDRARMAPVLSLLRRQKCEVRTCDGGEEALGEARRAAPDLAVVDVGGDRFDGFALAEQLAGKEETSALPVVLTAEQDSPDLFRSAADAGAQELLVPPWDASDVLHRLHPLFRISTQRAELACRLALARERGLISRDRESAAGDTRPPNVLAVGPSRRGQLYLNESPGARCRQSWCENAEEAQAMLGGGDFDAVVLSTDSEEQAGEALELCAMIRANRRMYHLPILILAAPKCLPDVAEPYVRGASRVLRLPVTAEAFAFTLESLISRRWRLLRRLREVIETTRTETTCDALTGVYDLAFLTAYLGVRVAAARPRRRYLSLILLSVPDVVSVREAFGDAAGDHLMRQIARWVDELVRLEDLTARTGPEELCVALPDTPLPEAEAAVHRVAGALRRTEFAVDGVFRPMPVTVASSLTELTPDDTVDDLLARARTSLR